MEETLANLKQELENQLKQAADEIRLYEQKLALAKEHYLKVAGALEYHAVLNQKYNESIDSNALSLIE